MPSKKAKVVLSLQAQIETVKRLAVIPVTPSKLKGCEDAIKVLFEQKVLESSGTAKTPKFILRKSPDAQSTELMQLVLKAGANGLPLSKVVKLKEGIELLRSKGEITEIDNKIYLPKFSPEESIRTALLEKIKFGEIWLKDGLIGKGKNAVLKADALHHLVTKGILRECKIIVSVGKSASGFELVKLSENTDDEIPSWSKVKPVIQKLTMNRADGAVSFEELAEALGIAVAGAKTIVIHAEAAGQPIVWVPSEPRTVRFPKTSGLIHNDNIYYRFRLDT